MKRSFPSGASPALYPSKSRLVEAICIHLCQKITDSYSLIRTDGTEQYISRWKTILEEYKSLRTRLFNSQRLLEQTDITLFNINETILTLRFKEKTRRDEIVTLMQGRPLPKDIVLAASKLPKVRNPLENLQGQQALCYT